MKDFFGSFVVIKITRAIFHRLSLNVFRIRAKKVPLFLKPNTYFPFIFIVCLEIFIFLDRRRNDFSF